MKIFAILISLLLFASSKYQARRIEVINKDTRDVTIFAQTLKYNGRPDYLVESCGTLKFMQSAWLGKECFPDDKYVLLKFGRPAHDGSSDSWDNFDFALLPPGQWKTIWIQPKDSEEASLSDEL